MSALRHSSLSFLKAQAFHRELLPCNSSYSTLFSNESPTSLVKQEGRAVAYPLATPSNTFTWPSRHLPGEELPFPFHFLLSSIPLCILLLFVVFFSSQVIGRSLGMVAGIKWSSPLSHFILCSLW